MKLPLTIAALVLLSSVSAFAGENGSVPEERMQIYRQKEENTDGISLSVNQLKISSIKHIDERISNSQLEKSCVQSSNTREEISFCREKYRPQKHQEGSR